MKTWPKLFLLICLVNGLLALGQNNGYDDDIYYSSKDAKTMAAAKKKQQDNSNTSSPQDQNNNSDGSVQNQAGGNNNNSNSNTGNGYKNDTFDYDDYYDYAYATRLRRFHNPCYNLGYYDNYYTNSYWYDYNPYHYGVSIYMGYNWWGPTYSIYSYYPSYSWGGYYGSSWYNNPYQSWGYGGYGYGGYHNGYSDGYWNGYNAGAHNNYYYNSYDNNSHYYGPRKTISSNGRVTTGPSGFAKKYEDAMGTSEISGYDRNRNTSPIINNSIENPANEIHGNNNSNLSTMPREDRNNNMLNHQDKPNTINASDRDFKQEPSKPNFNSRPTEEINPNVIDRTNPNPANNDINNFGKEPVMNKSNENRPAEMRPQARPDFQKIDFNNNSSPNMNSNRNNNNISRPERSAPTAAPERQRPSHEGVRPRR